MQRHDLRALMAEYLKTVEGGYTGEGYGTGRQNAEFELEAFITWVERCEEGEQKHEGRA